MMRDLNPTYSFVEMIGLIDKLESVKEFERLGNVLCSDLDHYTASEYLTIKEKYLKAQKPIWNKEFDKKVEFMKGCTARKNKK